MKILSLPWWSPAYGLSARESKGLPNRFLDHPLVKERNLLQDYNESVLLLAEETKTMLAHETRRLVNTEVHSGNFLLSDSGAYLMDWEKAVESCPRTWPFHRAHHHPAQD